MRQRFARIHSRPRARRCQPPACGRRPAADRCRGAFALAGPKLISRHVSEGRCLCVLCGRSLWQGTVATWNNASPGPHDISIRIANEETAMKRVVILLVVLVCGSALLAAQGRGNQPSAPQKLTAIRAGRVVDPENGTAAANQIILLGAE